MTRLLCIALCLLAPQRAVGETIDRIVVVVGDRWVTASDIEIEAVLTEIDPSPVAVVQHRRSDPLVWLTDQAVIRAVAGDVSLYQPSTAEVRARLNRVRNTWPDPNEYQMFLYRHGLDEDALLGILYSKLVVERYVQRNIVLRAEADGSSPEEVIQAYEQWIAQRRGEARIRNIQPQERP